MIRYFKDKPFLFLLVIAIAAVLITYVSLQAYSERYQGRSKNVYNLNPRSLEVNPMGNVQQIMLNLQNPRECKEELKAVTDNPYVSQEDMDKLYNCVNNPYDKYLIRSLPFGKNV